MSTPDGATVRLDDEIVGATPWTGQTTPGEHVATLELAGHAPSTVAFTLAENRSLDVRMVLSRGPTPQSSQPPVASEPASTLRREESRPRVRARSWVLLGGGAGLLGVAAGFEGARARAEQDARDAEIQIDARESIDDMQRYETTARTFAAVGVAVTVVGGLSLVFDLRSSRPRRASFFPSFDCRGDSCWVAALGNF